MRPARREFTPRINPCSCLRKTGSKNKLGPVSLVSGVGPTQMSSDRSILDRYEIVLMKTLKSLRTNHWSGEQGKHCCWELMKTQNAVRNICKNMALVSFRSHVNTSENLHFGIDLNLYRSHLNGVWIPARVEPASFCCLVRCFTCWNSWVHIFDKNCNCVLVPLMVVYTASPNISM